MKLKQIIAGASVAAIIAVAGTTAFAANESSDKALKHFNNPAITENGERPERVKLTDEQKAEMEAKQAERKAEMEAKNEKWAALTDAQKEEVYALQEKAIDTESQIIDKYLELGLMDETVASEMKTRLAENKAKIRESDKVPGFGGMGGGHGADGGKGFIGAPPDKADETDN